MADDPGAWRARRVTTPSQSAFYAAEEMLKLEEAAGRLAGSEQDASVRVPLNAWEERVVVAADLNGPYFRTLDRTRERIWRAAYLLIDHNDWVRAAERVLLAIEMEPGAKDSLDGGLLVLDGLLQSRNYDKVRELVPELMFMDGIHPMLKRDVASLLEQLETGR